MSGKKLKRLLSTKVDSRKKDLLQTIYKGVRNNKKQYNLDRLLKASQKLSRYLLSIKKGEPFDFDTYNSLFFNFLSESYAEGHRDSRKVHPSSLRYECERKMFYSLKGVEYSDRVADNIDGRLQMIFDLGHWFHGYIQATLLEMGILVQAEVPIRDKERFVDGRMDGKIYWEGEFIALEVKTMNSYRFKIGKIAPFEDNEYQAGFYASKLGLKKVCYLYFNKDTCEIAIHIKKVRTKLVELADEKIDYVLDSIDRGVAPEGVCEKRTDKVALSCPFRTVCFK